MNDWNSLLRQSVNEFKPKRTVTIRAKQKKDRSMYMRIIFGVLVNIVLFLCWLTNQDVQAYLIGDVLWSILYGCYTLQKA